MRPTEREKPKIKGIWRWVGESTAMVRERGDEKEERCLVWERVSTMEREMRDRGEKN